MAMRSALGASRARIIGQLFVEALVLASIAAAVGLIAADRTLRWGIESVAEGKGGVPFWMTPGLEITTILYAGGLAVAGAALRVAPAGAESHANAPATAFDESGCWRQHAPLRPRLDDRHDRAGGADGHRHPERHRGRQPGDS